MTLIGWAQIALFCLLTVALTRPVGGFMTKLAEGEHTFLWLPLRPVEKAWYWVCGVDETREQSWVGYAVAMMLFKIAAFVFSYVIIRLQTYLPFNPDGQGPVSPDLAFNTAISFVTNTNWQSYGGETTMSYFTQMAALTVQNFTSAAAGIAMAIAVIRGFSRRSAKSIGNFWVDMTRITIYVLIPFSIVLTLFYVWQGMPQTLAGHANAVTLEGVKQAISVGPVASQEAIKILGTNGGGFFNVNSAHPFENPNALTNFFQVLSIFVLGAALTNVFGRMVKDERQGWAVFAAMGVLFLAGVAVIYWSESHGNPAFASLGVDPSLGNMEGKEVRFGASASALFATATTDASCGAVNSMHESFLPLGGMIPLINIMLGEIIFGGVGSGLYGFVLFAIVAVFVAGLMVGRTPEYLGKKLEAREIKMTMLAILCLPLSMLGFTALTLLLPGPMGGVSASGPHGFSEVLYAFVSATGNNGSAFAGLSANTPYWNTMLGLAMIIGRFVFVIPALCVAGSLAAKKTLPPSAGTFPTHGPLFVGLTVGVILIVGGLTFFPALALGPVVEHFAMNAGTLY
jgi:K+-transporting ATPase ATPase A chain